MISPELAQQIEKYINIKNSPSIQFQLIPDYGVEFTPEEYQANPQYYLKLIQEKLEEPKPTFQQTLMEQVHEKFENEADLYKKADLDRRLFSKIRSDDQYHPSKDTVVKLALALELSPKDAASFLSLAGYSLSTADKRDMIISFCIDKAIFDLMEVDQILDHFQLPLLCTVK